MATVRSPELYGRLVMYFRDVRVKFPGEPFVYSEIEDPFHPDRVRVEILSWGETYQVSCPICGDVKRHLDINHCYGRPRPGGGVWTTLLKCYRRDCFGDPINRRYMASLLLGPGLPTLSLVPAVAAPSGETVIPPGPTIYRIDTLPSTHPAVRYLIDQRGYEMDTLVRYGVGYIAETYPAYDAVLGRIYLPVTYRGSLRGWQARRIDLPGSVARGPRYYGMRGGWKSRCLYGLDQAIGFAAAVIMEGPLDVIRFGPPAVALMGKDISRHQIGLLEENWRQKPIIVCLDGGCRDESRRIVERLCRIWPVPLVREVCLPEGVDPGDMSRDQLRRYILASLQ